MKLTIFLLLVFIGFTSSTKVTRKHVNNIEIMFGKGGGITGEYEKYYLSKIGVLSKYSVSDNKRKYIKTISKVKHTYILKKASTKSLTDFNLNESGNMNCFIELSKGLKVYKKYQWPIEKPGLPNELKELDSLLNALL